MRVTRVVLTNDPELTDAFTVPPYRGERLVQWLVGLLPLVVAAVLMIA